MMNYNKKNFKLIVNMVFSLNIYELINELFKIKFLNLIYYYIFNILYLI